MAHAKDLLRRVEHLALGIGDGLQVPGVSRLIVWAPMMARTKKRFELVEHLDFGSRGG